MENTNKSCSGEIEKSYYDEKLGMTMKPYILGSDIKEENIEEKNEDENEKVEVDILENKKEETASISFIENLKTIQKQNEKIKELNKKLKAEKEQAKSSERVLLDYKYQIKEQEEKIKNLNINHSQNIKKIENQKTEINKKEKLLKDVKQEQNNLNNNVMTKNSQYIEIVKEHKQLKNLLIDDLLSFLKNKLLGFDLEKIYKYQQFIISSIENFKYQKNYFDNINFNREVNEFSNNKIDFKLTSSDITYNTLQFRFTELKYYLEELIQKILNDNDEEIFLNSFSINININAKNNSNVDLDNLTLSYLIISKILVDALVKQDILKDDTLKYFENMKIEVETKENLKRNECYFQIIKNKK